MRISDGKRTGGGCGLIRDERPGSAPDPDCRKCIEYGTCERAAEGSFCTRYRTKAAPDRGEGPADAWSRGEDI